MATTYSKALTALQARLPEQQLEAVGGFVGFIRRVRLIGASPLVWATVLSRFSSGAPAFASARHWYQRLTGSCSALRPFQLRFKSAAAAKLFESAFDLAVQSWRKEPRRLRHPLARHFSDIVLLDSSLISVADVLRPIFKGQRNIPAQIKVLLAVSAFGSLPLFASLSPGTKGDPLVFPPLSLFRRGTLWLFDRGFMAFDRLREMNASGHHFLLPMKSTTNATVVTIRQGPAWARKAFRRNSSLKLRDLLPRNKRIGRTWDLDVLFTSHKAGRGTPLPMRLVIVPGRHQQQHGYLTNLPATPWSPLTIRELYRLRWQIELVFKELKQDLNLDTIPTKDPHAAQVFVWASLIALAISRTVSACLASLSALIGLAARLRPAIVSRALRSSVRLLARVLRGSPYSSIFLEELVEQTRLEARPDHSPRSDSFARLAAMLPA